MRTTEHGMGDGGSQLTSAPNMPAVWCRRTARQKYTTEHTLAEYAQTVYTSTDTFYYTYSDWFYEYHHGDINYRDTKTTYITQYNYR